MKPDAGHLSSNVRMALYPLFNNLYYVHLDIIDVCAKWLPRRERDDERAWLGLQLQRETQEIPIYRSYVDALGFEPTRDIRIPDSLNRYEALKASEDEVDILVGMNVIAQSVIGTVEHTQFCRFDPTFFAPLVDVLAWEAGNLERVLVMLKRRDLEHVEALIASYYEHLLTVTKPQLMPLLEPVIALGIFQGDVVDQSITRLVTIARRLGVKPPGDSEDVAAATLLSV
jgi:hypothetical protein